MTLEVQFLSMLASAGTGIWFGASFDTYKRFTRSSKRFRWTKVLNDLLFWILQALVFFYVLFIVNYGEIRFYFFLALLLGYATYRALLDRLYAQILEWVIKLLQITVHFFTTMIKVLVINPSIWLLKVLISLCMIMLTVIWRSVSFLLKILLFPFRFLVNKYVQAYGIPFYPLYTRLSQWWEKIWKKDANNHDE